MDFTVDAEGRFKLVPKPAAAAAPGRRRASRLSRLWRRSSINTAAIAGALAERRLGGQLVKPPRKLWRYVVFRIVASPLFTVLVFLVILATFYFLATECAHEHFAHEHFSPLLLPHLSLPTCSLPTAP